MLTFLTRHARGALAALLIATATICCSVPCAADDCKRVANLLVLFDASGFMKDKDRYGVLLTQMNLLQQAMPLTADGFFNVGVRHYGLKVGMGCENTESILAIGPWDPERFMNCFPKTVSYGVSSLAAGLRGAADDAGVANGKTIILVVGGGLESCKADPIKITEQICSSNPDVEIHCFQIGAAQDGTFYLRGIAEKGRGSYTLLDQTNSPAQWYAWMKRHALVPCTPKVVTPVGPSPSQAVAPIRFHKDSVSLRSKDPAMDAANLMSLNAVGQTAGADPAVRVVLHGYSGEKPTIKQNLKLSRKRAEAVAQYLINTHKIQVSRISIMAHGTAKEPSTGTVEFEISQ
jgi:outer membrane protein OmpA-like peptidoglycan-associated protein